MVGAAIALVAFGAPWHEGRASPCERSWSAKITSPDRKWTADLHEDVCDAGLGAAAQELVDLVPRADPARRTTVLIPTGQWTNPAQVEARWLGPKTLEVSVPNRTRFEVRRAHHNGIEIRIRYRDDNPVDRAKWLDWVKRHAEWVAGNASGTEPKPPTAPR